MAISVVSRPDDKCRGKCESKIEVSLGVVSFLWFVSLDKQRNEQKSIINAVAVNSFVQKEKLETRINERRRQTTAADNEEYSSLKKSLPSLREVLPFKGDL